MEGKAMKRPVIGFAVVLLALAASVSPAVGAAPERYTFEDVFSDTIDCSTFDPGWTFNDDFVDFFEGRGQVWLDAAGQPIRAIEHVVHRSNDVNSVTGLTLHEHNHFVAQIDFIGGGARPEGGGKNIHGPPPGGGTPQPRPQALPA